MVTPDHRQIEHRAWIAAARQQSDEADRGVLSDGSSIAGGLPPLKADHIPGYELEREIHRGAQGAVYRAVQKGTGRRVAVKLLHDHALGSRLEEARFEREMRVLAVLQHPNIVAIHDGGSHEGRFYLVMDYIAGQPLDKYLHDKRLSLHEIVDLCIQVCEAVNAAHLQGIIHRDLKPANVRVDESGRPHVLDFGLAKFSTQPPESSSATAIMGPAVTQTGQFIGSLPWSAPEQADGSPSRIDVRTDVYSLGVLLYQMLTDRFPYSVSGPMKETLEAIVHHEPTPPRRHRSDVDDELETIVLKCLQKEPARRYQSAGDVARDLRRYLAGEPIEAKRDSLPYVLRKGLRRHWLPAGVAAAFVIVIGVGLIVSLTQWRTAIRERNEAIEARKREQVARQLAADEAGRANSANDFLQTMLSSANPAVSQGRDLTVREVLDVAAQRVERGELSNQPRVEAAVRHTLGRSYLSLGQLNVAEQQLKVALRLNEQVEGARSKAYGESLCWLGVLEQRRNHFDHAEQLQREALDIFRSLNPEEPELIANSLSELAYMADYQGRRDEGLALTRESLDYYRRAFEPGHPEITSMESMLAARSHDLSDSVEQAQRSVDAHVARYGEKHPEVARALTRLAAALTGQSDLPRAVKTQERAVKLMREIFKDESPDTLFAAAELAGQYRRIGQEEKAVALLAELLPAAEKIHGRCNETRLTYMVLSASVMARSGDVAGAEREYRSVIDVDGCPEWATEPMSLNARFALAELILDRGECDAAEPLVMACKSYAESNPGRASPGMIARILCIRGEIQLCRKEFAQAEILLLEAHSRIAKSIMVGRGFKDRIAGDLVRVYEAWEAAEPGTGKAEKAAEWKSREPASQSSP